MIPVTDPFGIAAPDGNTYFKVLGPPRALITCYDLMLVAIRNYRRASQVAKNPRDQALNRSRAEMIERALGRMRSELTSLGTRGAILAREQIVQNIDHTQVRPDPPKNGKRLRDLIVCRPIAAAAPSGAIGIADMKFLNLVPYWRAQEFGYTLKDPRIIPGFFMPGYARPDPAQIRAHPIFEQMQYARGMPALNLPAGTRIALERKFLRDGVSRTAEWRLLGLGRIQRDAVAQLQRAGGVSPVTIGPRGTIRRPPRPGPRL